MTGPVLVTGAAGFLGAQIIRALIHHGIPPVALVRQRRRAWRLAELSGLTLVEAEMTQPDTVVRAVDISRPFAIINAASYGVNSSERNMNAMVEVNVTAVHELMKAAQASGVRRFIHLGTYSEYGDHPVLTEETPLRPKDAYGATKAAASLIVSSSEIAKDLDTAVLRLFNIWGPMEGYNRLIPAVIRHCQTKKPFQLTSGTQAKDYSFAPDLAHWIVNFTCYPEIYPFRVVNFASGRTITVHDFVLAVARSLGGEHLMHFGAKPTPAGEAQTGPPDTTRIETLLPNRQFTELNDAVAQVMAAPEAPGTKKASQLT